MKLIMIHCLIISLILISGNPPLVFAVTDAELEALEKQILQQELEDKQRIEAEAKRQEEQKNKVEAESRKKQEEEAKRRDETEAKRKAEEARLAEIERQRQEEEAKKIAEEDAKKKEEEKRQQFSQQMRIADSAMNNKNYKEALQLYTQALEIFPSDPVALAGQSKAQEYQDVCGAIVGEWDWVFGVFVIISANGNLEARALISNTGKWECTDPSLRKFTLNWVVGGWVDTLTLSDDGNTLNGINNIGMGVQGWRKGTRKKDPSQDIKL